MLAAMEIAGCVLFHWGASDQEFEFDVAFEDIDGA